MGSMPPGTVGMSGWFGPACFPFPAHIESSFKSSTGR